MCYGTLHTMGAIAEDIDSLIENKKVIEVDTVQLSPGFGICKKQTFLGIFRNFSINNL